MVEMKACRICNGKLGDAFDVREMMFGSREKFAYEKCEKCGSIQIAELPEAMEKHYPYYYYSLKVEVPKLLPLPFFKKLFNNYRIKKKYRTHGHEIFRYFRDLQIMPSQKILDVGCGKGKLICEMFNFGFQHVEGVDKFINQEYDYNYGVRVYKKDLGELKPNTYDVIMMHHVFEHMDKPGEELAKCSVLLKKDGYLIIRIPLVARAWEIYQQDWIQLDAPRHFFLHTEKSMAILAEREDLKIERIVYDSDGFQFWGSELYRQDIPYADDATKELNEPTAFFTEEELAAYNAKAELLNAEHQGDQAIFYLRKK
jgi:SAM-dependent methyltransferase